MQDRIEKQIEIAAPVSRVWTALTDHKRFGQWFGAKLDAPFTPGASILGQITSCGFEHAYLRMGIQRIEPERVFSYTWNPYAVDSAIDYAKETPTLVEFTLTPNGSGTLLTVVETGFGSLLEHRRAEAFRMNSGGWPKQLENIKNHVGG